MDSTSDQRYDAKKNFGLSPDAFNEHLEKLRRGDEMLFEIIFKSHFEMCRSFLVRKMGAGNDVSYDITLETLMKFRKNLLIGKIQYGNMAALFTIDARNNYLRWREKETRYDEVSVESQEQVLTDETDDTSLNMERVQNLKRALLNIGKDCYELLNWHYYLKMTLRTIAESRFQRGDDKFVNEASVKTKVAECRKKLRTLLS